MCSELIFFNDVHINQTGKVKEENAVFRTCHWLRGVAAAGRWGDTVIRLTRPPTSILSSSRLTAMPQPSNTIHLPAQPAPRLPGRAGRTARTHRYTQTIRQRACLCVRFEFELRKFRSVSPLQKHMNHDFSEKRAKLPYLVTLSGFNFVCSGPKHLVFSTTATERSVISRRGRCHGLMASVSK